MKLFDQKGFATQLMVLLLLVAGIGLGTYLVQSRTNTSSEAAGRTVACDGQTLAGQSAQSRADFKAVFGANAETAWVSEHEANLKKEGKPCNGGGSNTTNSTTNKTTNSTTNKTTNSTSNKTTNKTTNSTTNKTTNSTVNTNTPATQTCQEQMGDAYLKAKVASRVARYIAILKGAPSYCVPADLGVDPALNNYPMKKVDGDPADFKKTGRLYVCSGADSKPDKLVLVWRVIDDEGTNIRDVDDSAKSSLPADAANLPNFAAAKQKIGLP